jgi:hypothetical protein
MVICDLYAYIAAIASFKENTRGQDGVDARLRRPDGVDDAPSPIDRAGGDGLEYWKRTSIFVTVGRARQISEF